MIDVAMFLLLTTLIIFVFRKVADYDYINVVLDFFSHSYLCHKKVVSLQQE